MIHKEVLERYLKPGMTLVETGTDEGVTVAMALSLGAKEVWTIERDQAKVDRATLKFKGKPVHVVMGDSGKMLGAVLEKAGGGSVLWLDAHDPNGTAILDELRQIASSPERPRTILIDDMRYFRTGYWKDVMGPITQVRIWAAIPPEYKIGLDRGIEKDDILVARMKAERE